MRTAPTTYWDDLVEDLKDPEFLRAYNTESLRVETIDRLVNDLDEAIPERRRNRPRPPSPPNKGRVDGD